MALKPIKCTDKVSEGKIELSKKVPLSSLLDFVLARFKFKVAPETGMPDGSINFPEIGLPSFCVCLAKTKPLSVFFT
ncbi:hypothetical protein D3C81_870800 [compost metagenome]